MIPAVNPPQITQISWEVLSKRFTTKAVLNLSQLTAIQRILLTSDGTLTDLLECYSLEPIQVIKLTEEPIFITGQSPLEITPETEATERKILLHGQHSGQNWLYAESVIVNERLQQQFNHGLLNSNKPIGKLWTEYKVETFKESLYYFSESAGELANHFGIAASEVLLCRTYRVFSQRQPIMLITEKFPSCFYQKT